MLAGVGMPADIERADHFYPDMVRRVGRQVRACGDRGFLADGVAEQPDQRAEALLPREAVRDDLLLQQPFGQRRPGRVRRDEKKGQGGYLARDFIPFLAGHHVVGTRLVDQFRYPPDRHRLTPRQAPPAPARTAGIGAVIGMDVVGRADEQSRPRPSSSSYRRMAWCGTRSAAVSHRETLLSFAVPGQQPPRNAVANTDALEVPVWPEHPVHPQQPADALPDPEARVGGFPCALRNSGSTPTGDHS